MAFSPDDMLESDNVDAARERNRRLGYRSDPDPTAGRHVFTCRVCKSYKSDTRVRSICANCQNVIDGGVGPQVSIDAVAAMLKARAK